MYDSSSDSVTVPGAEAYAKSGWNLNNLPNLKVCEYIFTHIIIKDHINVYIHSLGISVETY